MNKKHYDIRIYYKTGDSFNSYDREDMLEIPMESREIAKENLQRIKKHWEIYESKHSYPYKKDIEYPDFYITEYLDEDDTNYKWSCDGIKIKINETKEHNILHPFWIGYFEHLHGAEIVLVDDEEDEMSFRT